MTSSPGFHKFSKFALVGVVATLVDLISFYMFRQLSLSILLANIGSSSVALTCSYMLNKKFTFQSGRKASVSLPLFILVTVTGVWILQPIFIYIWLAIFSLPFFDTLFNETLGVSSGYVEVIAKLFATPVSLTWNYILYSKVVFRKE